MKKKQTLHAILLGERRVRTSIYTALEVRPTLAGAGETVTKHLVQIFVIINVPLAATLFSYPSSPPIPAQPRFPLYPSTSTKMLFKSATLFFGLVASASAAPALLDVGVGAQVGHIAGGESGVSFVP